MSATQGLKRGLWALARAGARREGSWFEGHIGAAAICAAFFARDRAARLPESARVLIDAEVKSLFDRFPHLESEAPVGEPAASVAPIIAAIGKHMAALCHSGHGVIYGALALAALREAPELATQSVVSGVAALLERTLGDRWDRYFGVRDYRQAHSISDLPGFRSVGEAIPIALAELEPLYPDQAVEGRLYFFGAEHIHVLTHLQALALLEDLGLLDLVRTGLEPLRLQIELSRHRPPLDRAAPLSRRSEDARLPFSAAYWERPDEDGHLVKVAYAAYDLLARLPESEREVAELSLTPAWRYAMSRIAPMG